VTYEDDSSNNDKEPDEGKHADRARKPARETAIGAGNFFEHLTNFTGMVEIFDAQIKPLKDSYEGAVDELSRFLRTSNLAAFAQKAFKARVSLQEFKQELPEVARDLSQQRYDLPLTAKDLANNEITIDSNANLDIIAYTLMDLSKKVEARGTFNIIRWVTHILNKMGVDNENIIKTYYDDEEGNPSLKVSVNLDEQVIQSLINREADRRFFLIPEVAKAREHAQGLMRSAVALGHEDDVDDQHTLLRKIAGDKYEKIIEEVHQEALGKARFHRPFDGGGPGNDDPTPDPGPIGGGGRGQG